MKKFAFPFSTSCKDDAERAECIKIFDELGYHRYHIQSLSLMVSNRGGVNGSYTDLSSYNKHDHDRHHIPHFDAALIRDIAAACTNDTWQKDEPLIHSYVNGLYGKNVIDFEYIYRRPTLAEICAHHGYKIKGKDIVKIEPKQEEPNWRSPYQFSVPLYQYTKLLEDYHEVRDKVTQFKEENGKLKSKLSKILHVINNPN